MKTSLIFIVGCLLGVYNSGSNAGIVEEIFNGQTAAKGQFPYGVFLQLTLVNSKKSVCGGSLISDTWVLTAAHCTDGAVSAELTFGVVNYSDPTATKVTVPHKNFHRHPRYNPKNALNDVSLLKLPSALKMTDTIAAINLPKKSQAAVDTFKDQLATVSGWGRTRVNVPAPYPTQQFATVYVMSNKDCQKTFGKFVTDGNLCTDKRIYKGSCPGDSGGPLAINGTDGKPLLIGAVSFSSRNCEDKKPKVYTNVAYFLDWISTTSGIVVQ